MQINNIMNGEAPIPTRIAEDGKRYAIVDGKEVQLRADGMPRRKPGRKPGTTVKSKQQSDDGDTKMHKAGRRDADAAPMQRKRKIAPATNADVGADSKSLSDQSPFSNPFPHNPRQHPHQSSPRSQSRDLFSNADERLHLSQKALKLESPIPRYMQGILNEQSDDQMPSPASTLRSSGQRYDPIRGNYDPVRETAHNTSNSNGGNMDENWAPLSSAPAGELVRNPRFAKPTPSIASLIEPSPTSSGPTAPAVNTLINSTTSFLRHNTDTGSVSESSAHPLRPAAPSLNLRPVSSSTPLAAPAPVSTSTTAAETQKHALSLDNIAQTVRKGASKPRLTSTLTASSHAGLSHGLDDDTPQPSERSILDFGKAGPGEELQAPTIVLEIRIREGETNKYVNFLRMAEDCYGWDALHPRQAANRDRKARIAAASAALEKASAGSGRESGDEMSVDLSDAEGSNAEAGGSGIDVQAKPVRKKRNFKEDEYDVDDDFVDDSELQWENQAAASRDGFFVYMGPLVREVEKAPLTG
jgi:hypothetical protein